MVWIRLKGARQPVNCPVAEGLNVSDFLDKVCGDASVFLASFGVTRYHVALFESEQQHQDHPHQALRGDVEVGSIEGITYDTPLYLHYEDTAAAAPSAAATLIETAATAAAAAAGAAAAAAARASRARSRQGTCSSARVPNQLPANCRGQTPQTKQHITRHLASAPTRPPAGARTHLAGAAGAAAATAAATGAAMVSASSSLSSFSSATVRVGGAARGAASAEVAVSTGVLHTHIVLPTMSEARLRVRVEYESTETGIKSRIADHVTLFASSTINGFVQRQDNRTVIEIEGGRPAIEQMVSWLNQSMGAYQMKQQPTEFFVVGKYSSFRVRKSWGAMRDGSSGNVTEEGLSASSLSDSRPAHSFSGST